MLDVLQLKKVALKMQLFVVKVTKCKQGSILTPIQNANSLKLYLLPTELKMQNDGPLRHICC
jgi:hypothetical protein